MAVEIELKFLVKGEFRHFAVRETNIIQAYLSVDPERIIRLRIFNDRAILAIKSNTNKTFATRNEWEIEIPASMADEILEVCLPGRIDKTRYLVPYKDHTFEVDVFHGKNDGLIIAELELNSEAEAFEKPDWLGEEVTGNPAYYNSNLI
jgi:CYTH domain-containing protein